MGQTKAEFRQQLKINPHQKSSVEEGALNSVLREFLKAQSGTWAAYKNLSHESSVDHSIAESTHLRWAYPKVKNNELEFFTPGPHGFATGKFGIEEPVPEDAQSIEFGKVSGALIPGLAFDLKGNRLGHGYGFYDRILKNWHGIKVGIALGHQMFTEIVAQAHDQKMDFVVTPVGVIHCHGPSAK